MIETNAIHESKPEEKPGSAGCLGELGWFLSGAVLPMGSFAYYRKAAQRSVGSAILFFVVFTLVITTILTISFGVSTLLLVNGIQQAYADGDVPEITISGGIAEVDGPQPFIIIDQTGANGERVLVATDTSGEITEIDTSRYYQGFLLTRTELHILNQQRNDYQVLPLSELHVMFEKDPILINSDTVSQAWQVLSGILIILVFIFLALWHTVARLMVLMLIALVAWGIVSLMKPKTGFSPIIIAGIYAIVPAIYVSHLFSRSGLSFPALQTFFLVVFWTLGLIATFMDVKFFQDDRPLRLWTALVGLPMLILYAVDVVWAFPSPDGPIALWLVTLFTMLVLVGLRLYFRYRDQTPPQAPDGQPAPGIPPSSSADDDHSSRDQLST